MNDDLLAYLYEVFCILDDRLEDGTNASISLRAAWKKVCFSEPEGEDPKNPADEVTDLLGANKKLVERNTVLIKENEEIRKDKWALAEEIKKLQRINKEIQGINQALTDKNEGLMKANAELSRRCDAVKGDWRAAEKILNQLKEFLEENWG